MQCRRNAGGTRSPRSNLVRREWIATLIVARGRGESEHVRAIESEGLLADIVVRMVTSEPSWV